MLSKIVLLNSLFFFLLFICPFVDGSPINLHKDHQSKGKTVDETSSTRTGKRPHPPHKSVLQLGRAAFCTLLSNGHWSWHNILNVWDWKVWTGYGCLWVTHQQAVYLSNFIFPLKVVVLEVVGMCRWMRSTSMLF